jgi:hypothetical protein
MALSKAELQAVIDAATNVPPNLQEDVHFTFSAAFIVNLFQGLIALTDAKDVAVARVVELEAELTAQAAPVQIAEEPIEEIKP